MLLMKFIFSVFINNGEIRFLVHFSGINLRLFFSFVIFLFLKESCNYVMKIYLIFFISMLYNNNNNNNNNNIQNFQ